MWRVAGAQRIWRTTTCSIGKQNLGEMKVLKMQCSKICRNDLCWLSSPMENYKQPLLFRFPSTSPLKPIPCPAPAATSGTVKKRPSFRDKESFFRFKSIKKHEKETEVCKWANTTAVSSVLSKMIKTVCGASSSSACEFQENVDPALQSEGKNQPVGGQQAERRQLIVEDEQEIWRYITLTQYKHTRSNK